MHPIVLNQCKYDLISKYSSTILLTMVAQFVMPYETKIGPIPWAENPQV